MSHSYSFISARPWFKASLGLLGFCGALLAASTVQAQSTKIEAEAATLSGATTVATTITPFSGTGYVDFTNKPAAVTFAFNNTGAAGAFDLVIRYESHFGFKLADLSVNGSAKAPVYLNATPSTSGFLSTSKLRVTMNAGANTIVISDNYSYYGIDYIQLTPATAAPTPLTPTAAGRVEAEAGILTATQAYVRDDDTGTHSGSSYVAGFSESVAAGSTISLPVNVATAGLYQIAVGARGLFGGKSFDLAVATSDHAGGKLTTAVAESPGAFASYVVGKYPMTAGTNTITITSQTSYVEIDYVDVTATTGVATASRASADAQKALTTYPNPTNGQSLNVSLELATAQETTFDLVNNLGQRVRTTTRSLRAGANQLQLPTAGVAGGLYQLVVRSGDQPTLVQRVVVN